VSVLGKGLDFKALNDSSINTLIEEEELREQKKLKSTFLFKFSEKKAGENDLRSVCVIFMYLLLSFEMIWYLKVY